MTRRMCGEILVAVQPSVPRQRFADKIERSSRRIWSALLVQTNGFGCSLDVARVWRARSLTVTVSIGRPVRSGVLRQYHVQGLRYL